MDSITQLQDEIEKLLVIMSSTISYLTTRSNFKQVSADVPVTKKRNPEKVDTPEVFEENKNELIHDLVVKAKQIEHLIQSLPGPEPEEQQVMRLARLEEEMNEASGDYIRAVNRAKDLYAQINETLRAMLQDTAPPLEAPD